MSTLTDETGRQFRMTTKRLGRGTFAQVFLGEWLNPHLAGEGVVPVAIKQFHLTQMDRNVQMEIDIMRQMDHPNIVKLITAIQDDESMLIVLEYCAGGDFRTFIKDKRLSEKWACRFLLQIANGLQYLRSKNVVHRDLKPHNLLLSKDRKHVKIADFGFAKIVGSEALAATMCGTPLYMAPEILRGDEYNSKADLWSVGIILYEMLCGERPYKDIKSVVTLQQKVENAPILFPRRVQISNPCKSLLRGLLVKDPGQRIEWDDFFDNEWLKTDWDAAESSFDVGSVDDVGSVGDVTTNRPKGIPQSKPIAMPAMPAKPAISIKANMVRDYMMIPSTSAPAGMPALATPPLRSSVSFSITPRSSVFVPSTTPHAGSDVVGGSISSLQQSTTPRSQSFKHTLSDVFSTGFGLLKDSFQSDY